MSNRSHFLEQLWVGICTNLGTKIISVVIAIVLWIVVLGSRNVEVTKDVPIELVTPSELVASNDVPDHVTFRLSGPKAFLRAILDRHEDPIRINLVGSKAGLVTYRFFSDNIRVPIGVKILGITPVSIVIKLEQIKSREVPVKVELQGTPQDGYKLTRVQITPEAVKIKGAESRVDAVAELRSTPIDVTELKQTTEKEIPFDLARYGVMIEGKLPRVLLNVESVVANYRVKNVDIRVSSSFNVRIEEKNVTVLIKADAKDLKTLDRSRVFGTIDMSKLAKGTYTMPVKMTLPPNVSLVKVVPDKVTVTLY